MQRDPGELRVKLATTVDRAWNLNQALEVAVSEKPRGVRPEVTSRSIEAPLPWNSQAAYLVLELHRTARVNELQLLAHLTTDWADRERGGSSANTERALRHIAVLVEPMTEDVVLNTLRWLDQWCTRAELALGTLEPVTSLPVAPGGTPMRCPWCDYLTLRVRTATATAYCVNPGCHYSPDDARRPQGRVETDPVTGVISICWRGRLPEDTLEAA